MGINYYHIDHPSFFKYGYISVFAPFCLTIKASCAEDTRDTPIKLDFVTHMSRCKNYKAKYIFEAFHEPYMNSYLVPSNISKVGLRYEDIMVFDERLKGIKIPGDNCWEPNYWSGACEYALMLFKFGDDRAKLLKKTQDAGIAALKARDANAIENLISYPLNVFETKNDFSYKFGEGKRYDIKNKEEFFAKFNELFTSDTIYVEDNDQEMGSSGVTGDGIKIVSAINLDINSVPSRCYIFFVDLLCPDVISACEFIDYDEHVRTCPNVQAKITSVTVYEEP